MKQQLIKIAPPENSIINALNPEEKLLLLSANLQLTNPDLLLAEQLVLQIVNWQQLTTQAINRGMGPMLYKLLKHPEIRDNVSAAILKTLEASYFTTLRRNILLSNAWSELANTLSLSNIKVVALKGIYLSEHLYGDVGLRQLSDIDILVKPEDGEKSLKILSSLGYQTTENPFSTELRLDNEFIHYPTMIKDGLAVEVHIRFHRPSQKFQLNTKAFFERAEPVTINGTKAFTLAFYDQLIFLCVHSEKHFTGSKIQFTCFTDLANILFRNSDSIDWEKLIALSCENRCETVVFKHLLLTSHFFNAPVPEFYKKKYSYTVNHNDFEVFVRFLRGYINTGNHINNFGSNVAGIKGWGNKIKFIVKNLFPSKDYMISRYHIRNPKIYRLYYLYRLFIALSSVFGKFRRSAKWVKSK